MVTIETAHREHKNQSSKRGFTLVETLVALLILSFFLVSVTALMTRTIRATSISQDREIAAKLAQEGIELIKAKRNTNMAQQLNFDRNLIGVFEPDIAQVSVVYNTNARFLEATTPPRVFCIRTAPATLVGKYTYCVEGESKPLPGNFTRVVSVQYVPHHSGGDPYSISVTSTVTWGDSNSVEVTAVLYPMM